MPTPILHNAEAISGMLEMKASGQMVDGLVADPPYASGALHASGKKIATGTKYQQTGVQTTYDDFCGDARDQLSWVTWQTIWLNAARQILKPGAPVLLFSDWRQLGATIQALQAGGFIFRGVAVWAKKTARPMPGRFRNQCEYVVWGSHGSMPNRDLYLPGIFHAMAPSGAARVHQTQKPLELMRQLLAIVPNPGTVLDPFAGSGSTLIAASQIGLDSIGFEENKTIHETATERLAAELS